MSRSRSDVKVGQAADRAGVAHRSDFLETGERHCDSHALALSRQQAMPHAPVAQVSNPINLTIIASLSACGGESASIYYFLSSVQMKYVFANCTCRSGTTPEFRDELVITHSLPPISITWLRPCHTVFPRDADISFYHKGLREQLLAAGASGSGPPPYPPSSTAPANAEHPYQPSDSASPHDQYDPSSGAQPPYGMSGDSAGDDGLSPDARKGKRELSTSKRAAQNRAAQVWLMP